MTDRAGDRNNAAMRPQTLPPLLTTLRKLGEVAQILDRLDNATLAELWRRAEQSSEVDGYPAASMGLGVRSGSDDTSVEAAALADDPPDAILAALAEVASEVSEMHGLARRVDRRVVFAVATATSHRGRQSEGSDCLACDRFVSGASTDRLRSGFCNACFTAWTRFRQSRRGADHDPGALRAEFIRNRPPGENA